MAASPPGPAAPPSNPPTPPPPRRDGLFVAAAALALALILAQTAIHGFDAFVFLRQIAEESFANQQTLLYIPLAVLARRAGALCGLPLYESVRALSAVAVALGVYAAHRAAARHGCSRAEAFLVAALVAATPAVLYFGTVVEIDPVFFAAAGLAWWCQAGASRTHALPAAIALGLATAFAAAFHGAGHLLAGATACATAARTAANAPLARRVLAAGTALVTHAVAFAPAVLLAKKGGGGQADQAANLLHMGVDPTVFATVAWREWLLAFAPASLLLLLAFARPGWRLWTAGLLVCAAVYLTVNAQVFGLLWPTGPYLPQGAMREFGSFQLGLAFPAALLATVGTPRAWRPLAVVAGFALGIATVRATDWGPEPPGFVAGWRAATAGHRVEVIFADLREMSWVVRREPTASEWSVARMRITLMNLADEPAWRGRTLGAEEVAAWFQLHVQEAAAAGKEVWLTAAAQRALEASDDARLRRWWRELLPTQFALAPAGSGSFAAVALRPR